MRIYVLLARPTCPYALALVGRAMRILPTRSGTTASHVQLDSTLVFVVDIINSTIEVRKIKIKSCFIRALSLEYVTFS